MSHLLERMIDELRLPPSNVHVIGFSLGAHLAGLVGQQLKEKGKVLGRITGETQKYLLILHFTYVHQLRNATHFFLYKNREEVEKISVWVGEFH